MKKAPDIRSISPTNLIPMKSAGWLGLTTQENCYTTVYTTTTEFPLTPYMSNVCTSCSVYCIYHCSHTYPCRQQWQVEPGRTCTECTTSTGSPCNCGDWAVELRDVPERPVAANKNTKKSEIVVIQPFLNLFTGTLSFMSPLCVQYTHSLDALFIDTDAPEQGFKNFGQCEGKEANGAEVQTVSHLLQDGRCFLLNVISSPACLFGNLHSSKFYSSKQNKMS